MATLAWHNELQVKTMALEQLRQDQLFDRFAKRIYWINGRGCYLGCLTRCGVGQNPQAATEWMFGIPKKVAYWLEAVFEGLPHNENGKWVIDSAEAIPVGADLSLSHHHLFAWLLSDDSPSAKGNTDPSVSEFISCFRKLHERASEGKIISKEEWMEVESTAPDSVVESRNLPRLSTKIALWSIASGVTFPVTLQYVVSSANDRPAAWRKIGRKSLEIFRESGLRSEPHMESDHQESDASYELKGGVITTHDPNKENCKCMPIRSAPKRPMAVV